MNQKFSLLIAALLLISLSVGCGGNVTVTGKVTFADGTPLTEGTVVFQTPMMVSKGRIQEDGTYTLSTGEEKGIPRGSYQVSISGLGLPRVESFMPPGAMTPRIRATPTVSPIDSKYFNPDTSGLVCEVKGRTTFNITVEPPAR